MKRLVLNVSVAATLAVATLQAQNPLSGDVKAAYQPAKINILKAAEKMPESEYGFKPTPDVRTFGQLIAHVADAQIGMCGVARGEPRRGDAASKTSKSDLISALKASNDVCDGVYNTITDADGATIVKMFGREKPKLGVLNFNIAHDNEMYGTISVDLRLKGIVPPSSEGAAARGR
jgi:DinB superfamily